AFQSDLARTPSIRRRYTDPQRKQRRATPDRGEISMDILKGIRVIDVTIMAFGPSSAGVLAHWGADVIKVENSKNADPMRIINGSTEPWKSSVMYKHYNMGKRAVALDLSKPEGRELLYKLVKDADVFVTSFLTPT